MCARGVAFSDPQRTPRVPQGRRGAQIRRPLQAPTALAPRGQELSALLAADAPEPGDTPHAAFARSYAKALADLVWDPPCGCSPALRGAAEDEARAPASLR